MDKERAVDSFQYRWARPYGSYSNAEIRALTFKSIKECDRAIDLLWSDPDLIGMPRHYGNNITMFVPQEAVELFKSKRLKFTVSELVDTNTLSPEQLAERRLKHGM